MGSKNLRRAQGHAILWIMVIIIASGSFVAAYTYTGGFKGSVSPYNPTNPTVINTSAGSGACLTDGTVHVVTSPGPCYNVAQFVQVHLFDFYAGSSLSGWSCTFFTLSGGSWVFAEAVTNTASNGNCVTTGTYSPGTPMYVWVCHQSSACSSSSYSQQETVFFAPLPPPNGLTVGAGTVSLANVPATSAPTDTTNMPITLLAGDKAASNTPYVIQIVGPNGTIIPSGSQCKLTATSGSGQSCFLGGAGSGAGCTSSLCKATFGIKVTPTFASSTYPYGLGFASFSAVNNPSRGLLSSGMTQEIKQTSGTDFALPNVLGSTFTSNGQYLTSVDKLYYATPSDSSITKTVAVDGTVTNTGASTQSFTVDASSQAGATGGDQTTITFKFYVFFSVSFYTANGAVNSEAVTQASTSTLIFTT